ncbi:hypothetical protein AM1_H0107 (plasmid) [Acaryochloris marina MBIC11017]|uniref:Uncharacterized protein n=1 Tax=Acaryochloris marina (strain MBIC 11017) TaxID=329726 RepID=A8ZR21_ACAM1|nr:hypothetical protein AM1_H0107 [Acaryochloris marina MBIC11017]
MLEEDLDKFIGNFFAHTFIVVAPDIRFINSTLMPWPAAEA